MKKRILCTALSLCLCLGLSAPALAAGPTFTDVPANHWAYASVEKMADEGVMTGIGGGKFNPTGTITYGEFFTMMTRAFYPQSLALAQTKEYESIATNGWWMAAISTADATGLMNNTALDALHKDPTAFGLNEPWHGWWEVERDSVAQTLANLLANAGYSVTEAELEAAKAKIPDLDDGYAMRKDAVATVYALGLMKGDDQGNFRPKGSMTRAEAAVLMDRLLDYGIVVSNDNATTFKYAIGDTTATTPTPDAETSNDTIGTITPASQVKASIGKSDAYPTKGGAYYMANDESYIADGENGLLDYDGAVSNAQKLSNNGYRTGANVEIGNAELVYELLDMVNEMRAEGGMDPVKWVPNDAAEEYTLLRAYETTTFWSHDRANGSDGLSNGEDIAKGTSSVESAFNAWKNSPGHYKSLMWDTNLYMCAARCGNYWVITLWNEYGIQNVEYYGATSNYYNS